MDYSCSTVDYCALLSTTQYSSTVYIGIAVVYPQLKNIYKHFVHFHFQFEVLMLPRKNNHLTKIG